MKIFEVGFENVDLCRPKRVQELHERCDCLFAHANIRTNRNDSREDRHRFEQDLHLQRGEPFQIVLFGRASHIGELRVRRLALRSNAEEKREAGFVL